MKSIAIITLTLLATATVHAGALAEMSGRLAEQQKSKLANQLVEIVCKRLIRTVLIFTESSDQLSRATDRVPGLPASPGYVQ
ncbi:hypothetical protein AB0V82_21600 [Escherichia coli]